MDTLVKDWTHKEVRITDIRKLSEFYIFTIDHSQVPGALLVKSNIFEERLKTYFLKEPHRVTREEILDVKWNMYITKGYYIKISSAGTAQNYDMDPSKYYVSYLEISGSLGTFQSIYKDKDKDHKIS
jgi:hypothetical protein